jgi:hypothetical protein
MHRHHCHLPGGHVGLCCKALSMVLLQRFCGCVTVGLVWLGVISIGFVGPTAFGLSRAWCIVWPAGGGRECREGLL